MLRVLVAGDFAPRFRVATQIENGDYGCLDEVRPIIQSTDYSIVNFESPVVIQNIEPLAKTGPNLRSTEKAMDCIAQAGFKCVTLANNHFRDFGQIGVENTINACAKYGLNYVGGGKDKREAIRILYKRINDQTLAIINYCENEFSICSDNYGGSNPLNPIKNYYDIREACKCADYILVIVHGGVEGYQLPTPRMVETYRFFIDSGVDVVVNHHQHCCSGYEIYKGKPIFYGLGNLSFDKINSSVLWQSGYFISICFEENISFEIYPYSQGSEKNAGVVLLKEERRDLFFDKLCQVNEIISNTTVLEKKFKALVSSLTAHRLSELEPFRNKYVQALQIRGLLPSFVSSKTRYDTYDMINCESHREILLEVLKEAIIKNRWNIFKK